MSAGQLLKQANHLKRAGKLDEAIALYHHAIAINPDFAWTYYELGDALAKNSQPEDASIVYQRAIDTNQKSVCFSYALEKLLRQPSHKQVKSKQKTVTYTKNFLESSIYKDFVECGEYTYGQPRILHWGEPAKLIIGKYCSIASEVCIFLGGNHRTDWVTTYPFTALPDWPAAKDISGHPATKGNVVIGNDVWIGFNATILSGVTIGDGAVIGANAVVTKAVSPYSIVAGNPAKLIKYRFDQEKIEKLLKISWWKWEKEKVSSLVPLLLSNNVETFLENCQ